jgi:hypothetical protein
MHTVMSSSDTIAIINAVATVSAVVIAPLAALWIAGKLQRRADSRAEKVRILSILLSLRHQVLSPESIRSMNLVDVVFAKDRPVREAWSRYYAALSDSSLNAPPGLALREEKRRDLILAIAKAVGLEDDITTADVLRAYGPTLSAKEDQLHLLRVDIELAEARARATEMKLPGWSFPPSEPGGPQGPGGG